MRTCCLQSFPRRDVFAMEAAVGKALTRPRVAWGKATPRGQICRWSSVQTHSQLATVSNSKLQIISDQSTAPLRCQRQRKMGVERGKGAQKLTLVWLSPLAQHSRASLGWCSSDVVSFFLNCISMDYFAAARAAPKS